METAETHNNYALFFEQGTGKTASAINWYRRKCQLEGKLLKLMIFCPPIVVTQWRKEFLNHSKVGDKVLCLRGSQAKRVEEFRNKKPAIVVTNYEALLMKNLFELFLEYGFDMGIWDESQRVKNPEAKRSVSAAMLADRAKYNLILSGTPILNSPIDIFQQFRVLDGGETFGRNFYAFRAIYFEDKNAGMPRDKYFPDWRPRPQCFEDLNQLIYKKAMRVMKSDCLDLPPLVRQEYEVEMGDEQARCYEEMKEEFITILQDQACTAQLAVTKSLRLQQIVSGFIKMEDGSEVVFEENPRLTALKELLSEISPPNKVIIWSIFKQNHKMIASVCKELGLGYAELHGDIGTKERDAGIHNFRSDPDTRVLIASPQAGGVGLNLVEASFSIWFSRSFSLEHDLQAEARNHRGGSEIHEKITRIDLVCPNTLDELVLDALKKKQSVSDVILQWKDKL